MGSGMGTDGDAGAREGAAAAADVLVELGAEELQGGDDRAGGAVAQGAEGAPEDRVADVLEGVHVLRPTLAGLQPAEDLAHPVGALPRSEERRVGKECRSRWS